MFVKAEINNFNKIAAMVWSGAVDVCNEIIMQKRENEAMRLIEEMFLEEIPTETQLNDFVWFELGHLMHLWDTEDDDEDDDDDDDEDDDDDDDEDDDDDDDEDDEEE